MLTRLGKVDVSWDLYGTILKLSKKTSGRDGFNLYTQKFGINLSQDVLSVPTTFEWNIVSLTLNF